MMVIMIMVMMTMMVMITWVSLMISCLSLSTSSGPAILTKVSAQLQKASSWSVELISQDIHLQQWWNPNILTTRRSLSQAALAISEVTAHLQSQVWDFTWTSSRHNHNHNHNHRPPTTTQPHTHLSTRTTTDTKTTTATTPMTTNLLPTPGRWTLVLTIRRQVGGELRGGTAAAPPPSGCGPDPEHTSRHPVKSWEHKSRPFCKVSNAFGNF